MKLTVCFKGPPRVGTTMAQGPTKPTTGGDSDTHAPLADGSPLAEAAVDAFLAGLAAAQPDVIVKRAVRQGWLDDWFVSRERPHMIHVLALGKAAPRMVWGLVEAGAPFRGLGVAPRGVAAPGVDTFRWLPGDHPIPAAASFAAGKEVLAWCDAMPKDAPLLVLLSGGASACVEWPASGHTEAEIVALHARLATAGLPIAELNRQRAETSAIKQGRLGARLLQRTRNIRVWVLADTDPVDAPAVVGSAPFFQADEAARVPHRVLASVEEPLVAAGLRLGSQGWSVFRHARRIAGPLAAEAAAFAAALEGLPRDRDVALVAGGEADLALPADHPPGGRAQHAALAIAATLGQGGPDRLVLCAATDGVDGGTDAAGAWATPRDATPQAAAALRAFAAHAYFDGRGQLLQTGPTGTNLNDLWIGLRRAA